MPQQKPNRSVQVVQTPPDFMTAVRRRFGPISWDLAANADNHQADRWFGPGSPHPDAFAVAEWPRLRASWAWLNMEFGDIDRWVERVAREARLGLRALVLTPCSPGTEWFNRWVRPNAYVLELAPRLKFVGHKGGFPKELILSVFTPERLTGRQFWRWKDTRRGKMVTA